MQRSTLKELLRLTVILSVASCSPAPEVKAPDRAMEVAAADSVLAGVRFDTITWMDAGERVMHGNSVYAASCTRCHGYLGAGGTEYAKRRALEVPSLVARDWKYAGDIAGVRARVFSGHDAGMPTWGLRGDAGLSLRDVDAVAWYVVTQLRSDVLTPARPGLSARR